MKKASGGEKVRGLRGRSLGPLGSKRLDPTLSELIEAKTVSSCESLILGIHPDKPSACSIFLDG